jgi:murein L,D-transpeptidase YcbB/YkuD
VTDSGPGRHETIPRIRKYPEYLASHHIRVFDDWGDDAREPESQQRTVKNLSKPLPVHLTQETAWIDGDGRLRFAPGVYRRDHRLEQSPYRHPIGRD